MQNSEARRVLEEFVMFLANNAQELPFQLLLFARFDEENSDDLAVSAFSDLGDLEDATLWFAEECHVRRCLGGHAPDFEDMSNNTYLLANGFGRYYTN